MSLHLKILWSLCFFVLCCSLYGMQGLFERKRKLTIVESADILCSIKRAKEAYNQQLLAWKKEQELAELNAFLNGKPATDQLFHRKTTSSQPPSDLKTLYAAIDCVIEEKQNTQVNTQAKS